MNINFNSSNSIINSINPSIKTSLKTFKNRISSFKKNYNKFTDIDKNQCLSIITKIKGQYKINNPELILMKRIGSNSRYGAVYLTTDSNKNFYATKLTVINESNHNEIIISSKLSSFVEEEKTPHFLLVYKYLKCNNPFNQKLPTIIKNSDYYIFICDIASGNLKQFLYEFQHNPKLLLNAYEQILMCILAFHYFTGGFYHSDCHYKNFLYHKIKPGGYFHYNIFGKDIYIKNLGYIFMIWDFGLVRTSPQRITQRLDDYFKISSIIYSMFRYSSYKQKNNKLINILNTILKYKNNYLSYFGNSDKNFFDVLFNIENLFIYELPSSKRTDSKIINKSPYFITDF
jgi:hypothetical protein